jgi:hypothetical protein
VSAWPSSKPELEAAQRALAAALGDEVSMVEGAAGADYEAGLLALRKGPLLEAAVHGLR